MSIGHYYKDVKNSTKKKHGKWLYFDQKGNLIEKRNYYKDSLHGESFTFHDNDSLNEKSNYYLGKLDGEYIQKNKLGGILIKGNHILGQKVGKWQYYYENEKINREEIYFPNFVTNLIFG